MPYNPTFAALSPLNNTNSASPSGVADSRTGQPIYIGGQVIGEYADLTSTEAAGLSAGQIGTLFSGRYRLVQVDAGATAANVAVGRVGYLSSPTQGVNVVTSADKAPAVGLRTVIFLNSITPGNYGFIQELGHANVMMPTAITGTAAIGAFVNGTAAGYGDVPTSQTYVPATLGRALTLPVAGQLCQVSLDLPVVQG